MHSEAERVHEAAVQPLRTVEEVEAVRSVLRGRLRDLVLFGLGINNGLRAGDLLRLTVGQLRAVSPGAMLTVREKGTGAPIPVAVPGAVYAVLQRYLAGLPEPDSASDRYLFAAGEGWSPITTQRLDEMTREWTRAAGLQGTYGAHTLRKTFGYIQRTRYGVGWDVLAVRFGHASPAVTARYLGFNGEPPTIPPLAEL